jgi:DNA-binding CsgD family transcriptional regulator
MSHNQAVIGHVSEIVGRDEELATIAGFFEATRRLPGALLIAGDAGIGKTTLWQESVSLAHKRSYRVLTARPVAVEAPLSFAGLGDLLEDSFNEVLPQLPGPQARALRIALLLEDAAASLPEPRATAAAFLGALRILAHDCPVLVAVDDVQWLDQASAEVLGFAARRIRREPIGFLIAQRVAEQEGELPPPLWRAFAEDRLVRVIVRPLTLGALQHILRARVGAPFPRSVLRRIHEMSGGNPFFALEIAQALERHGEPVGPGEPLPFPGNLAKLVQDRIATLPPESRAGLELVAATSTATLDLLADATGSEPLRALEPAIESGVVEVVRERIVFAHPLLASAVSSAVSPERGRELHRRLAEVVQDPERRARHLALAADGPNRRTAATLDEAAVAASARGATAAAAELVEHARRLTPSEDIDESVRRAIVAAAHHFEAGDAVRARALLEGALASAPSGDRRAEALAGLARAHAYEADLSVAAELFRRAIGEAVEGSRVRAEAEHGLATALLRMLEDLPAAARHAGAAADLAERRGDDAALGAYLGSRGVIEGLRGGAHAMDLMARAVAVERAQKKPADRRRAEFLRVLRGTRFMLGVVRSFTDDLDGARAELEVARVEALEIGDESSLPLILRYLSNVELISGDWNAAGRWAAEGYEAALQTGQPAQQSALAGSRALVEAHLGRSSAARASAAEGLALASTTGAAFGRMLSVWALGFLELSEGNAREAVRQLVPLAVELDAAGVGEPGVMRFVPDAVEASLTLGEFEQAESLLVDHERRGRRLSRDSALATAGRCRGLLLAARGNPDSAVAGIANVLNRGGLDHIPFERARTLLALGSAHRRARHKRAARDALDESVEVFERLGAVLWAEKARAELSRIGGRAPSRGALTPTERRVAALVVQGGSTKQVAAALVVSAKTVEGHLSNIYAKLGVHSRAELAHRLAGDKTG